VPADPDVLWLVCKQLLAGLVAHHGGDLPARQYVSAGAPAWDCPLVAVWCETTTGYEANPNVATQLTNRRGAGFAMRSGTFVLTIVRKTRAVAKGDSAPPVAREEEAAEALYTDQQRMVNALLAAVDADELPGCHSLALLDWRVLGPDGTSVAGELRVRVGLVRGA
jgi:hypothetical protein